MVLFVFLLSNRSLRHPHIKMDNASPTGAVHPALRRGRSRYSSAASNEVSQRAVSTATRLARNWYLFLAFTLALPEAFNEITVNKLVGIQIEGAVDQRRQGVIRHTEVVRDEAVRVDAVVFHASEECLQEVG